MERCDHCDNGHDPGDSYCRFCGAFVGQPLGPISEVAQKIRWALCCGRDHCNAAEHAGDHDMSDDRFAEQMGCEGKEIRRQAASCMPLFVAILERAESAEFRAGAAERDVTDATAWARQYEIDHGPFKTLPPVFMVTF